MSEIGIFGFGNVGKNFYSLLLDLDFKNIIICDEYLNDSTIQHNPTCLKGCKAIIICTAKKDLKEIFLQKLLKLSIQKEKIRFYMGCFYIPYWLKNNIKNYFDTLNQILFINNILSDTPNLTRLQKILKTAINSTTKTQKNAAFYDRVYQKDKSIKNYKTSIYYPGWEYACKILTEYGINNANILDIGCGSGDFAQMLYEKKFHQYKGIDFSIQALNIAKEKTPLWKNHFKLQDISKISKISKIYTHICIFEVLEHIDEDFSILEKIPSKTNIIASVPNFYSQGHVRIFENQETIISRYNHLLFFKDFFELELEGDRDKIFYFNAVKK
ncbi:class I SAM-dependent methyltransferase [Helicobacter sp. 13S00477-4]|uniref:class I SAM-dependent methyltransferase n=1 Tax=Helicobacter sp. 13S00477-4 TaxID=1905759 RepID=UPI000BA705C5|nr:class I SAM-dependent methyltransferase [Helicobacter sp. 13S00477-4]PAF52442.1 hypothetical protein BKH44_02660 [Helicobacter sp. 13S00477-4]